ncbi:XdhC family protein [Catenulispora subtropica]|uniref:XdhC family protein n=1 Tax=Catenulispora subtropica TaxID=450798 RepID=UPI0031D03DB2
MRDLLPVLLAWRAAGDPFVLATVVAAGGGPRELGAAMAVRMVDGVPGEVVGSVSGGCVEAGVFEAATEVLASGRPRLETYGLSDAEAVGLTCGGTLTVFIEPSTTGTSHLERVGEAVARDAGAAVVTVVEGPPELVGLHRGDGLRANGFAALADAVARDADALVEVGEPALRRYRLDGCPVPGKGPGRGAGWEAGPTGPTGSAGPIEPAGSTGSTEPAGRPTELAGPTGPTEPAEPAGSIGSTGSTEPRHAAASTDLVTVFFNVLSSPPRLIILGALDHAASLAGVGRFLGYHVTVCDARAVFATSERFPDAHEVVVAWPHRYLAETPIDARTAICVLTHDPKFDVPALEVALRSPAGYIGAMGSRRTCADRIERLRAAGVAEHELARLVSPIGLDLGAVTPSETAVSIAAELIAVRRRGSGEHLRDTEGRIHR